MSPTTHVKDLTRVVLPDESLDDIVLAGVFDLLVTDERYRALPLRPALAALLSDVGYDVELRPSRWREQDVVVERGLARLQQWAPMARLFAADGVAKRAMGIQGDWID
jgi:hypothetical protein